MARNAAVRQKNIGFLGPRCKFLQTHPGSANGQRRSRNTYPVVLKAGAQSNRVVGGNIHFAELDHIYTIRGSDLPQNIVDVVLHGLF